MRNDVRAQLQRPLKIGRKKSVVTDHQRAVFVRQGPRPRECPRDSSGDWWAIPSRPPWAFLKRGPQLGGVAQVNVLGANLLVGENRLEQAIGAAIKVVVDDDRVARRRTS